MALAHPPPLVGAGIARPRDGRSPERPRGGGSRGPRRLSNAPSLARRVGWRDPLLCPPPQGGRRRSGAIYAQTQEQKALSAGGLLPAENLVPLAIENTQGDRVGR